MRTTLYVGFLVESIQELVLLLIVAMAKNLPCLSHYLEQYSEQHSLASIAIWFRDCKIPGHEAAETAPPPPPPPEAEFEWFRIGCVELTACTRRMRTRMQKWSRAPRPPPPPPPQNGLGSPPFSSVVWCGVSVGVNPPPSFCPFGVGCCGWESPFLLPPSGVGSCGCGNPPPSPLWCGVWWGRVRAGKSWWARGGREASPVRQTIFLFCGRRFCSETLGCPFKCFGRLWRFLLGTMQYRAIKSVLMTSRPPAIDYTLCHILYIIYSRVYTMYYRLSPVYMVYLYTIARPLEGGSQVLHTSLRAMWEPDYSILQHTIV